jgi:hypothetical protein
MNDLNGNPFFSSIKNIYLKNPDGNLLNISRQNPQCQFERLELSESVYELMPKGALIVRDTIDIISFIDKNSINDVRLEFADGTSTDLGISSITHITNAASDTEENFIGIFFTTEVYKKVQNTSLIKDLSYVKPVLEKIDSFVQEIVTKTGFSTGIVDKTSNFVLYKPLNALSTREHNPSGDTIQYLNYLASFSVDEADKKPNFFFWTDLTGKFNFKYFHRDPDKDPSYGTVDNDFRRVGVFEGDDVIRKLPDGKKYRKAYAILSNPAFQYVSKNYYYIKKTPKFLDVVPSGISADPNYSIKALTFQFQDEGEKYNIELISSAGATQGIPGAEQLVYDSHWGFYSDLDAVNAENYLNHIGQQFGLDKPYSELPLMGLTGVMPYVDTADMWKNMFDMTEIHPNYPDISGVTNASAMYLSKVLDIRYESFKSKINNVQDKLTKIRDIELQNFIFYSLCCMGNREDCFFALLQKYEIDNVSPTNTTKANAKKYRYKWNKLYYDSGITGATGATSASPPAPGATGSTGFTYYHQIEKWLLDDSLKSSDTQDETWAINLNERGITGTYLPPGWVDVCLPDGFYFRPVGAKTPNLLPEEDIFHIVKLCKHSDGENFVYYFTVENVVDGCCDGTVIGNTGPTGPTGGNP